MKNARILTVAILLAFAWRGEIKTALWPPASKPEAVVTDKPDDESLAWTAGISAAGMTPKDRMYVADFYAAVGYIIKQDGARKSPVIGTGQQFSVFHAGSLQLAIDKGDVGRYPGLGASIDRAFFAAAEDDDDKSMTPELRDRFVRCCNALAWRFTIHADE